MRCVANTQDGRRCRTAAAPSYYCDYHQAEAARGWLRAIGIYSKLGGNPPPFMFRVKIEEAARKVGISSQEMEEIYRAAASEPLTPYLMGWLRRLFYSEPKAIFEEYKRGEADANRALKSLFDWVDTEYTRGDAARAWLRVWGIYSARWKDYPYLARQVEEAALDMDFTSREIEEISRAAAGEPITPYILGWLFRLVVGHPEYHRGFDDARRADAALFGAED